MAAGDNQAGKRDFGRRGVERRNHAQRQENGLEAGLAQKRGRALAILALAQDEKTKGRPGAQRRQPSKNSAPASATSRSAASSAMRSASARLPSTCVSCIRAPSGVRIMP